MSIKWFITPYDPKYWEDPEDQSEKPESDLNIDHVIYLRQLIKLWPEATFERDGNTYLGIEIPNTNGDALRVSLYHNNQIISINNNPTPEFFDFIVFHRRFVDIQYELHFFNSSSWESLELRAQTTVHDIKQFVGIRG